MKTIESKQVRYLEGAYQLTEFNIGEVTDSGVAPVPHMEVDGRTEVNQLFAEEMADFGRHVGKQYVRLPYVFFHTDGDGRVYGDFTNGNAGCSYEDLRFRLTAEPFHPETEMYNLFRLCQLLQPDKVFNSLDYCMFVRGLRVVEGELEMTLGPGLYTEAAFTVNSDGLVIGLSEGRKALLLRVLTSDQFDSMQALLDSFTAKYGRNQTVRSIVRKKYGRLPSLSEAYSYILGGASLLLTKDDDLIFARRSPGSTLVNHGINVPTSGGALFDEGALRRLGLPRYLQYEVLREATEELNIWGERISQILPLGLVRELARGCTSDALHLIRYRGTTEEAVEAIAQNRHASRREIDQKVYAMKVGDACRLIQDERAEGVLHHKALVAMVLAHRAGYLS